MPRPCAANCRNAIKAVGDSVARRVPSEEADQQSRQWPEGWEARANTSDRNFHVTPPPDTGDKFSQGQQLLAATRSLRTVYLRVKSPSSPPRKSSRHRSRRQLTITTLQHGQFTSVILQRGKILQASEEKDARNSHLPSSAQPKQGNLADGQAQDCHVGDDIRDRDAGKPYAFINACALCGGHAPGLPDGPTLEYGEETDRDPPHENDNTKRVSTNLHGS